MSTLVYQYGLRAPTENGDMVRDQIRLAHRYSNTLVEIERGRRAALRALLGTHLAPLEEATRAADAEVEAARLEIRAARANARARAETEPMLQRVKDAKDARRFAMAALREARASLRAGGSVAAEVDAIEERAKELRNNARAYSGLGEMGPHKGAWGTYLLVEAADDASRKMPLYNGHEANDPRFERFKGEGQVGVQVQNGIPAEEVFGDGVRIRVEPVDERAWYSESRTERRRAARTTLRLRVASDGRDPVWAAWPMIMHRPLPKGARIKRATVNLRLHGGARKTHEVWTLDVTLDVPEETRVRSCGKGAVAVDLGWRLLDGELRVAAWRGEDGARGELRLNAYEVAGFEKVRELRSIRDKNFDSARGALHARLAALEVPPWLSTRAAHLDQWKSANRLASLAREWKGKRFEGDTEAFKALEAWRYHDDHIRVWEARQSLGIHRHRREVFRTFAARMATRYEVVILEDWDKRETAKKAPVEEEDKLHANARRMRMIGASGEFAAVLKNAFTMRGGSLVLVEPAYSTKECRACGHVNVFDAATELSHTCSKCGARWDQDENAADVLLERWRASKPPGPSRDPEKVNEPNQSKEKKWERAARLRREREERTGGARKPSDKAAE